MSKSETLEEYIQYRSLSNHTDSINDIKNHVKMFIESSNKPLKEFDEKILISYISKITPKYKTGMLNQIKSSFLKNFIKWYYPDWSSRFRNLDKILRTEKTESKYDADDMIPEEDFQKLIKNEESHFWKAYFLTLFYSGSRPIEIANLKKSDVEMTNDGAFITISSKKNKKSFIKFVPLDVSFYLKKLMENPSDYVFYNEKTKKPITKKGAYWRIRNLSKATLGKEIDLYTLRHSIATIIYNKEGVKDDDIAKQMGHSKSMKGKYVHNDKKKLKEIAKSIYISPEELPPEKKHELELQIEKQQKEIEILKKGLIKQREIEKKMNEFTQTIKDFSKYIKDL